MTSFKDRVLAPYNGLKVHWFDNWHASLDEALNTLPELDACPHELFRLLIQNSGPSRKRIALITEHGTPVSVVGLRQKGRFSWEPVMQWIVPGEPFPSKSGYSMRAMEALNMEVWVAWWRVENPPPSSLLVRYLESTPTYRMHASDNLEDYWRETGQFKTIRRIRNRCKDLTLFFNKPGYAEWTIRNWEAKWRQMGVMPDPSLADRILAANYLEASKRYYTFTLFDGEIPAGAATMMAHRNDLVAGVLYYEPQYRKLGIGNRLIDIFFSFGVENGFETIDIGGGHEYKKNWAPQSGQRWWFHICPEPLYRIREVVKSGKRLLGSRASNEIQQVKVD
jgi:hypothetical protein